MGSVIGQKIDYLTIIPRARMGCESIAHEAEGRMGYIDLEAIRARGIIIVLVKSNLLVKNIENKKILAIVNLT